MSKILDTLRNLPPNNLGGTDKQFIDADTLVDSNGEKYRIQGVDAGEVAKYTPQGFSAGTAGGQVATETVQQLANKEGFTNVVPRLGPDGQPQRDEFGRILTDLRNKEGKSFSQSLLNADAFDINKYTLDSQIAGREIAAAQQEQARLGGEYEPDEFQKAANQINQAELAEGAKLQGFKVTALNEAQRAALKAAGLGHALTDDVQVRHFDRDINNVAENAYFSDAWEQGWLGAKEGMYGMMELLGEEFNNEWLNDVGEDGIYRMRAKQAEMGTFVTDWQDVKMDNAFEWIGNNIAMSLPYMAVTAGSAAAGAAASVVTGGGAAVALGVGLSAPASVYAGQVWNEMEGEKNAGVAVGAGLVQASLDRLGLGGIAGKLVPDRAFAQGVQHIMKKQGVSKEAAEEILQNATKLEARGLMQDALKTANKQMAAKQIGMDMLKRAGISAGLEGTTEVGQEATAYLAAVNGSDKQFDWEELNSRMIAAAIAGSAIGGTLAAPGALKQSIMEQDLIAGAERATKDTSSVAAQYAEMEKREKGYVPSIDENIMEANARGAGFESQQDRTARHNQRRKQMTFTEKAAKAALNPSALWQGATRNIFNPDLQARSRSARVLADMFGGNLQRIYSGANFENYKFHKVAKYKNLVSQPEQIWAIMGKGKRATAGLKAEISETLYRKLNDKNLNASDPDFQTVTKLKQELRTLGDEMYKDQKKYNPELGYVDDYLLKYKALDKRAVKDNQVAFQDLLVSEYNYSLSDAKKLTDEIIHNPEANDIDEAFSVVKGGFKPSSHKKRALGLSENKKFQDFMQKDLFANVSQAAKSAARYDAHQKFIGKNASVISSLLDQMEQEGVPQTEVDEVAAKLQDYLDAESGNYKRPTSDAGKKAQAIQKNIMMFMTMSGLPLATISSIVELMLVNRGLTQDQIWGEKGSIKAMGTEFAKTLISGAKEVASVTTRRDLDSDPKSAARDKLRELGFYDWDVGAATVTGVTEVNAFQQQLYENFFKATGLTGWTNYTRAARASMGMDYLTDNADIVWQGKMSGKEKTRDVQQAEEKLRNLGVDVDRFAELQTKVTGGMPLTEAEQAFMDDTIREATFNFVNEAIALPQSANRPILYQDPRFALFTQFQGFIATFTANHIPKLWGEYVKRGTPAMKYNAFATMATMIMMGFVSQAMKDYIKYESTDWIDDEELFEEKTGQNPYLDTPEYIQRGIYSSGLLGTAERPLQFFFPIYETSSDNVGDWAFNTAIGESPALGWLQRAGTAAGHIASGDVGRGATQAGKAFPLLGPFSAINKRIGDWAENWNFNGE